MKIKKVTPTVAEKLKPVAIRFMKNHGDGRITHKALRWFNKLTPEQFIASTWMAVAFDDKKMIGMIIFGDYGTSESLIAVHPYYRKQGVGEKLLLHGIDHLGKVYTRVACDNTASLKLCFSCQMVAIDMTKGPTGKPTLWLAGGNWNRQDLLKNASSSTTKNATASLQ
ncbi:GNAT family N-acetyltransferase [Hazenella sp. IB182357]|uniref:GNAT family N-acetyltransferase n=1 Tax=Polycladospora coralii TaxID=2771432 RepID=A0A926RTQ4_9BACL|nr:GNAT family N-acetyltransferase [Polycladospora coralii]MBD1373095.1 GNAT family N-acetyltransferase [Polycladospora coralii]MBS7529560.1 GNAT family N-acetyltransferase [Polycladospora coralii]